jgi:hypothetical protein
MGCIFIFFSGQGSLHGHALAAHEHALVDHHLENTQCPWLVQAAFVATDGRHVGRVFEGRAAFFAFVAQTVFGDERCWIVGHLHILDLGEKKSHFCFS